MANGIVRRMIFVFFLQVGIMQCSTQDNCDSTRGNPFVCAKSKTDDYSAFRLAGLPNFDGRLCPVAGVLDEAVKNKSSSSQIAELRCHSFRGYLEVDLFNCERTTAVLNDLINQSITSAERADSSILPGKLGCEKVDLEGADQVPCIVVKSNFCEQTVPYVNLLIAKSDEEKHAELTKLQQTGSICPTYGCSQQLFPEDWGCEDTKYNESREHNGICCPFPCKTKRTDSGYGELCPAICKEESSDACPDKCGTSQQVFLDSQFCRK
eukprot:m.296908 g.296908  ORF g.296908 m.296908 type:complete len:266 (+) comp16395_c0_seq3:240-1037(+)